MPSENDTSVAAAAQENEDFTSGFSNEPPKPKPAKPEPAAPSGAPAPVEEKPEYVQITAKELAEIRAAAAKTASYDQQFSKAFGTLGNLQKLVAGFQSQTPAGRKIEIPKDAFAAMERDFPELAQQTRSALEAALTGVHGTGASDVDADKIKSVMTSYIAEREIEALEDRWPNWREIVGAVDVTKQQPDPNNPFRKWLGTKDAAYQSRINGSESAAVIGRAIRLFQTETKPAPKPAATPQREARADRIRAAVQPRGDGAPAAASNKTDQDEFEAGFNSR